MLEGLQAGASSITAVAINSNINDIVARRMNDFWGNLYHQPEVHLVTDEGRSFVRRSSEKYDAIISVHTISNAAVASGALSLAENYVLTREAFEDYLDHLVADGTIFFTRPEFQIPRLFSTGREVFAGRGMGSIANHVLAYGVPGQMQAQARLSFVAGFLLKRSEFAPGELGEIRKVLIAAAGADAPTLKILYAPDEKQPDSLYSRIINAADFSDVLRTTDSQLEAATDDKPFFNQHTRWSRIRWGTIVDLFSQKQPRDARPALEDRPVAEVTLLVLLAQSVIVADLCILLPLALLNPRGHQAEGWWSWLAYFAALGLGFVMVEIALLQRFLLFLGQPIYTYAVVLAGLLIFTGIGSYAAGKWNLELTQALRRALLGALVVVLAMVVITPMGMMMGFRMVLLLACVCYLAGLLAISRVSGSRAQGDAAALPV